MLLHSDGLHSGYSGVYFCSRPIIYARSLTLSLIITNHTDNIGTIILNHPETRNSLSNRLLNDLIEALEFFEKRKARAVIIRAVAGVHVWSSGFDITELPVPGRDPLSYNDPLEQALRAIQLFPAPVIAMIEGSVWGGACDLSFICDIAIGCPTAAFAITPAKIGVPYNSTGILHFINVVGPRMTREMFFTARPIAAERAMQLGILNHLVPTEELEAFSYAMASQIAENSPLAIAVIKEQLRLLGNSHPLSPETFERIQGLRRKAYDSADYLEGKQAFLEKRKPVFKGE
ncbi:MAG: methylmalonyl-CoA decarboxylase [Geobacteraceae bacterium]|nr:methylmalonyl-CoA decarboxylase [Geobacteraceae bacterium]